MMILKNVNKNNNIFHKGAGNLRNCIKSQRNFKEYIDNPAILYYKIV